MNLALLPWAKRTRKLCMAAVTSPEFAGRHVGLIPERHLDEPLCVAMVENTYECYYFLPPKYRTPQVSAAAVRKGVPLENIPREHRTKEVCAIAERHYCSPIHAYPKAYRTRSLLLRYLQYSKLTLDDIPARENTPQFWDMVSHNAFIPLRHVPADKWTVPRVLAHVKARVEWSPPKLDEVPPHLRTPEVCEAYVLKYPPNLMDVPYARRTLKMCMVVVDNPHLFGLVPDRHRKAVIAKFNPTKDNPFGRLRDLLSPSSRAT